jgi:carboxyl-terminal processing protease
MNKKSLTLLLVLVFLGLVIAFNSQGKSDLQEDPKAKFSKILKSAGELIENDHFSPRKIDDNFSKEVLKQVLKNLDDEKTFFLQSDVKALSKYNNSIDEEIHGQDLQSFFAINDIYLKRVKEVSELYLPILAKPFDFSYDEKVMLDPDKRDYPVNEKDRAELWRKRLKYAVLTKYVEFRDERDSSKNKKDFIFKADSTLEREARDKVRKQMDRYFSTKKSRETQEENFSVFMNAITGLMDPHTNYFPPVDLRAFNESMSGRFYGIGAQLKEDDGKIIISSLVSGGPAWKSGELKENDEIIAVGQGNAESVDVTGYAVSDAVKLIRGSEKGTEVRLTVKRIDGSIKIIRIIRDEVNLEETFAKSAIINGKHKVGYIYLPEFYADFERPNGARCAVDVAKEIEKLKAEKVEGIVFDLRGNGGGSLYDVIQMAGLFISTGPICQVKGKYDKPTILPDKDSKIQYDGPLIVMVDGTSASASEIFSAAIQDYKRGVIIGASSTYGKGTVQKNIPLGQGLNIFSNDDPEMGVVKLTLQKFYRINGGATQLRGVTPDIVLPDRFDYLKFREKDNPAALQWDEIPRATYEPVRTDNYFDKVIANTNSEVKESAIFSSIKSSVNWLDQYNDREYSLNINKYKSEQKQLKETFNLLDSLVKLKAPLTLMNLNADTAKVNSTEDKREKNKQWLKARSNDVYIDESIKVMDRLILQNNTSSAKAKL